MRAAFATPGGREALALASPDVVAALDRGDTSDRLTRSLLRYVLRWSGRATPTGLLAAVATATPSATTRLSVASDVRGTGFAADLDDPDRWWPEPSLVDTGEHLHWYAGGQVVRVRATGDLRRGLAAADGCSRTELDRRTGGADRLVGVGLVASYPAVTQPPTRVTPPVQHSAVGVIAVQDGAPAYGPDLERRLVEAAEDARLVSASTTTPLVARFSRRFTARFGERWLPLPTALDHEVGVGELVSPEPLLAGLPGRRREESPDRVRVDLLLRALHEGATEVEAVDSDDPPPMPEAVGLLARLDVHGTVLVEAAYPTGSRLLGRFAHADPLLAQAIRLHHDREAARHPGAVLAEIAHLPSPAAAVVVARPALRDAEVVLHSAPGTGRTLRPADLLVGVVAGQVQLRLEDGTRVLPRLASAHDPAQSDHPLYRFLVELQGAGIGWTWGPLESAPHLPRVRRGRTLLSRQTWNVAGGSADELRARLPRWVAVVHGGQELPLDLDSAACRDLLDDELRRGHRRLREVWPLPEDSPATGPAGTYAAELVVALSRTGPVEPPVPPAIPRPAAARHLPGGERLALAVHCAPSVQDDLLLAARPLLAGRDWFFVRYADDLGPHLRLRVRDGADLFGPLRDLVDRPDVRSLRVDTYEPEVARYVDLDLAERVFAADSRAFADALPLDPVVRWRLAVRAVDDVWADADLATIEAVRDAYARENRWTAATRRAVGERFRAERQHLEGPRDPLLHRRFDEIDPLLRELPAHVRPSLAHMTVNRWLRSRQREQEAVVLDLVVRLRRARQARGT